MNINALNTQVLIIGGGYAGLTAKLFLAQAGINTIVIDSKHNKDKVNFNIINYPGIHNISNKNLLKKLRQQIRHYDSSFKVYKHIGQTVHLKPQNEKIIAICKRKIYVTKYIVLTYGATINRIQLPYNDPQINSHVLYNIEATTLKHNNIVTVIGSGDRCAQICDHLLSLNMHINIHVIVRSGVVRTTNTVMKNKNIQIHKFVQIIHIDMYNTQLLQIQIKNKVNHQQYTIYSHYIVIATGESYTQGIKGINIYDQHNRIAVNDADYTTVHSNIYAGGSAIQKNCQIVNACHHGSVIAMNIANKEKMGHMFQY